MNLSLGGLRDPIDGNRDTYSRLEHRAVEYAHSKGAVVVAAVGNGDQAPKVPWLYASYPAALPHVVGVSGMAQDGSIPAFSNRDAVYNDIAAPGQAIVSTLPRAITAQRPACVDQGYSPCGSTEFRASEGTSYAAAIVSAAAALLIAVRPDLAPEQVATLIERSAVDASAATGCRQCPLQRDNLSGWGRLDVLGALRALEGPLPVADRFETNDDAGDRAFTVRGGKNVLRATIDFWDDQIDVYRVHLRKGQGIALSLRGPERTDANLVLWKPGTSRVEGLSADVSMRAAQSARAGPREEPLPPVAQNRLALRRGEDRYARRGPRYAPLREEQVIARYRSTPSSPRTRVSPASWRASSRRWATTGSGTADDRARSVPSARRRGDDDGACAARHRDRDVLHAQPDGHGDGVVWTCRRRSSGRFVLGLGTQVKAHNERRFSVPFESPGPKLKEQVQALKHIWGAFQGNDDLSFKGRFYRHDYITPFFNPRPIDHPDIPIWLGGDAGTCTASSARSRTACTCTRSTRSTT